jgi:hypothetical protein
MDCIHKPEINCCLGGKCSDDKCPQSHSCCWQTPDNNKPTLGLCVLKDREGGNKNCDFKRGIPVKNCKLTESKENYLGSETNDDHKILIYLIAILIILLVILKRLIEVAFISK